MKSRDNINIQTITCEQIKALVNRKGEEKVPKTGQGP